MAVGLAPVAQQQFFDSSGHPLAGGLLFTYAAGSTSPLATFTDATGATPNANPIVLNSGGFASPGIWLTVNVAYKFVLQNSGGVTQWTEDNITAVTPAGVVGPQKQIFTNSGTFTVSTASIKITVTGGGGAGGGGTGVANTAGAGGGSGATAIKWLSGLTPTGSLTVTVGTGGAGASGSAGGNGVASTVSSGSILISTITGGGGFGGGTGTAQGGNGGTATGGDLNFAGNAGQFEIVAASNGTGQLGAASMWGGAPQGAGAGGANNGLPGGAPGAGGSGGSGGTGNTTGGAGAAGIVIFEWVA
jgi:hypothetical protein